MLSNSLLVSHKSNPAPFFFNSSSFTVTVSCFSYTCLVIEGTLWDDEGVREGGRGNREVKEKERDVEGLRKR